MAIQRWRDSLMGVRSRSWIDGPFEDLEKEMKEMAVKIDMMANMGSKQVSPPGAAYGGLSSAGAATFHASPDSRQHEYMRRLAFEFGNGNPQGFNLPFEYIQIVVSKPTGMVVVFFLGADGKPGWFEEEAIGFPSRELLAKLQLIRTS